MSSSSCITHFCPEDGGRGVLALLLLLGSGHTLPSSQSFPSWKLLLWQPYIPRSASLLRQLSSQGFWHGRRLWLSTRCFEAHTEASLLTFAFFCISWCADTYHPACSAVRWRASNTLSIAEHVAMFYLPLVLGTLDNSCKKKCIDI